MKRGLLALGAALALTVLAGCGGVHMNREDVYSIPGMGYIKDPEDVVAATDWSKARTVNVTVSSYDIAPGKVSFRQGAPYRLRLENIDEKRACYFASEDFFKAIAVQKLVTSRGVKTIPYYEEIAVLPGEVKELYFVPVKDGVYEMECESMGFALFGGASEFTVTASPGYQVPTRTAAAYAPPEGVQAATRPDDLRRRYRQVEAANIRSASRAELERIKAELADLVRLIRMREAELDAAGE